MILYFGDEIYIGSLEFCSYDDVEIKIFDIYILFDILGYESNIEVLCYCFNFR